MSYPADPPRVEEIVVAVMRQAGGVCTVTGSAG